MTKNAELELANAIIACRRELGQASDDLNGSTDLEDVAKQVVWSLKKLQIFVDKFIYREEAMLLDDDQDGRSERD